MFNQSEYMRQYRARNQGWIREKSKAYSRRYYNNHKADCNRASLDARFKRKFSLTLADRDAWRGSYVTFRRDMTPRPDGTTLDRIDSRQGYSSKNCRWVSNKLQAESRRKVNGGQLLLALDWTR